MFALLFCILSDTLFSKTRGDHFVLTSLILTFKPFSSLPCEVGYVPVLVLRTNGCREWSGQSDADFEDFLSKHNWILLSVFPSVRTFK